MLKKAIIVTFLLAIVLLAGAIFLTQSKKSEVTGNQLTKEEETITENVVTELYPQSIEAISGTSEAWYSIPEYGVRMRLNKEFSENLIYSFVHEKNANSNEEWDAVYFSTKSLTAIDNGCSPKEGSPLGVITKIKGNASELAKRDIFYSSRLKDIIQIGEYHYTWTGPQATCWDPKNDSAIQKVRGAEIYKAVQDGVKTIQLIPSK